ncbi:DUF3348 domain-containing protein [Trinickia caryophylli]|uniref:DUF3348 domain-containing protein n=1 Tax=Trinickia caryophylli TaxID=28094 RepID=A0A1X7D4H5_TRICW|nr:DUF3348 domain-containing protein [Trinickia caryophylli]PMS12765.1 DUF3348 domain-containing protein [Trinickia caryophylli]TRX15173.1 DUF3348 family protein [Trinickia caryophylli]WQE15037.1 DUF3348 domain-containing protein [Trinickia caryophylli]SMF08317.1 Protein of unknown function [Trinickia caryophylli]GLU31230.1 hypothetical protein Busp01_10720 [Trinickia caryophylli]
MENASRPSALRGPTLIRLLARLADADVPEPEQSISQRLSEWLDWTDAIALSTALSAPAAMPAGGAQAAPPAGGADTGECLRLRQQLTRVIVEDSAFAGLRQRSGGARAAHPAAIGEPDAAADFAFFRQRYLSMQQAMETGVSHLRGRLRRMLAAGEPRMARLAWVDAAMEQALGAREQMLLAGLPALLARYFERLRQGEQQALAQAAADACAETVPVAAGTWLDVFRKDMQSLLLAELDLRLQPVEGLLAALRTC